MNLSQKQIKFTFMIGQLIDYAYKNDMALTFGDSYRDSRCDYGHANSLHRSRLAVDFNLFIDGIYIKDPGPYKKLGEFWERIGGTWGGRFKNRDSNHFSLAHNGMF